MSAAVTMLQHGSAWAWAKGNRCTVPCMCNTLVAQLGLNLGPPAPPPRPAAGFQGEGVKTIVPHRAFVKLAARLVPDQTPNEVGTLGITFSVPYTRAWGPAVFVDGFVL